jgi:anaerobic dimethyl sulfoxide reductase subunit C (anchor subunit)
MGGEWSLVAFTVTGQLAVGLYLFVGIPVYLGLGDAGSRLGRAGRLDFLLAVLALLVLATALSLFHLHHPVKAYRTLVNLGRSWLSREILSLLFFAAAVAALTILEWRAAGGPALGSRILFILGGLAAVLFLATMSKLYMLPSVPTWNRIYTPLSFFLTSAVLGALAAAFLLSWGGPPKPWPFPALAFCGLAASFLNAVLLAPVYGVFGARPRPSLWPPGTGSAFLHAVRSFLLAAGGVILMIVLAAHEETSLERPGRAPALLLAVFVLAVAGEVSGRFLFYGLSGRRK